MILLTIFGSIALVLAAIGIYFVLDVILFHISIEGESACGVSPV